MEPTAVPQNAEVDLADDMLEGAEAIAQFLYGTDADEKTQKRNRRKVYYLATCTRLPIFRLGTVLCARKSVLMRFITEQEAECFRLLNDAEAAFA